MALKLQETGREFSQTRSDICANGSVIDDIVISFALGHEILMSISVIYQI